MDISTLTIIHTALSIIAIFFGIPVMMKLFGSRISCIWTNAFLLAAVTTTVTGFFFPFNGMTPAVGTGIVASLVFIVMLVAKRIFRRQGKWNSVYISGLVISECLLVFVAVAQAFQKIPALHVYAPTGTEPAFAVAELATLLVFAIIGFKAVRSSQPLVNCL